MSTGLDESLSADHTYCTSHYDNTISLLFDHKLHAYTVIEDGIKYLVPGVTSILDAINKPALVQWSANQTVEWILREFPTDQCRKDIIRDAYRQFKNKLPWDDNNGEDVTLTVQASHLARLLNEARFNYRNIKEDAANVGHMAHEWLEQLITRHLAGERGFTITLPEESRAKSCVQAALAWMNHHKFKPLSSERKLYSRKYGYAGTTDWDAEITSCGNPKCCPFEGTVKAIGDFKSSNSLHDEYRMQLAAYLQASEEEFNNLHYDVGVVLRLGKELGDFESMVLSRQELEEDLEGFLGTMRMFFWRKQIDLNEKARKIEEKELAAAEKEVEKQRIKEEKAALKAEAKRVKEALKAEKVKRPRVKGKTTLNITQETK